MSSKLYCDNVSLIVTMKNTLNMIRQTFVSAGYPVKLEGQLDKVAVSIDDVELLLSSLSFTHDLLEYLETKLKDEA